MTSATNTSSQPVSASAAEENPSLDDQVDALCQRVLAYASGAKVLHFRYCRRPHRPSSPHQSLQQALDALLRQLDQAAAHPICQTQAVDLLRELASLGQQPPCENVHQQKAVARKIDTALLELR